MHFEILGFKRGMVCSIELVTADVIDLKRKPTKIFSFKDPRKFVDVVVGHGSSIVYVGKVLGDAEEWKAYYWEPGYEEQRKHGYGTGDSVLPFGSLAILDMESEDDLEWHLKTRQEETRKWVGLWDQITNLAKDIRSVNERSEYADPERFRYMDVGDLENTLEKMKDEYQGLTKTARVEV